ncbi:MAG: retron St85 family RNA-directed DNA polymerase [Christensenellaceae bacterium]
MSKNTRSLLMDSLSLPRFDSIDDLAKLTGLSTRLLYCLSMKTSNYYKYTSILKRNGTPREISIPSYTLHIVQNWILVNILNKLMPSNRAMAFRSGKRFGHKQNAFYHSHTLYGLALDLKDFFPSITANKIYTIFSNIGYNNFAATILTNLCTLSGKLPQGSACSPAISNLICITLDKRLIGLCEKRGIMFTRYADDMYFSCDDKALLQKNLHVILKIINGEGFTVNDRKTHFHTPSNRKQITGITVAETNNNAFIELKAPKELKRKIRAEIFQSIMSGSYETKAHILGEISYVVFIEKENANPYLPRIKKYIRDLASKISFFPELVDAYNENLLFNDLDVIAQELIDITDEETYMEFAGLFEERKKYLQKNKIKDICQYSNWPETIALEEDTVLLQSDTNDNPF